VPPAYNFFSYYLADSEYTWLTDLVRCEAWYSFKKGLIPEHLEVGLQKLLKVGRETERDFLIVNYDVLSILQAVVGYKETTLSRIAHLLWLLDVAPIRPSFDISLSPGVVIVTGKTDLVELNYMPLEGKEL
jgi:hypothetical protein